MITLSKKPKGPKKEAGFTLIATIIFIILIGFLGVTASFLFTSGTTTTKDYLLSTQAFYAAEGGIERGIRQFLLNANGTHYNGEPINLTMGSQTFPVTISVSSLGTNQYNITSSCTYQSATRVVQQTVQMQSVFSQSTNTPSYVPYAITSGGNIILGGTTYTTCPGGSGCPSYLSTYQPQAPITVVSTGGSTINNPTLYYGHTYNDNSNTVNITSNLSLSGSGTSGVTLYCNQLTVGNNVSINTGSGTDSNYLLIMVSGNVSIGNSVTFKGAIYAPNGSIAIGNSFNLNGAIAGNSVSIGTSPSSITFDSGAGSNTPSGYNQTAIIAKVQNGWILE